jgi:hypothetical protein
MSIFGYVILLMFIFTAAGFVGKAIAGQDEYAAAAFCVAKGATHPMAFVFCMGTSVTKTELLKCATGGDCFGPSNTVHPMLQNALSDLTEGPGCGNEGSIVGGSVNGRASERYISESINSLGVLIGTRIGEV